MQLVPFSLSLLDALRNGLPIFDVRSPNPRVLDWPNKEFLEAIPHFIKTRAENRDIEKFSFLVLRISDSTIVGEIGAKTGISAQGELEIGFGIATSCRKMGYAKEALSEFVRIAFQEKNIVSIKAECLKENFASAHVLKNSKFFPVGSKKSDEGQLLVWRLSR